jgi:hypothetical protein
VAGADGSGEKDDMGSIGKEVYEGFKDGLLEERRCFWGVVG